MVRMDAYSDSDQFRPRGAEMVSSMDFEGNGVRIVMRGSEPWFVLSDVCRVLEYRDSFNASRNLDEDEKGTHIMSTPGGAQEMTIINESGLYSLILTSRKPAAKRFKKWVTAEVLPAIRKTGGYAAERMDYAMAEAVKLTSRELNAYARVVGEARRIAGRPSAVHVWVQTPLPSLPRHSPIPAPPSIAVDLAPPRRSVDGPACLKRLLSSPITRRPGLTLGDVMALARHDAATRNGLIKIGIMVNPTNWRGWVAIAMDHPRLQRVFLDSPWQANWSDALGGIHGARLGHDIDGFDRAWRAVLIPWDRVVTAMEV